MTEHLLEPQAGEAIIVYIEFPETSGIGYAGLSDDLDRLGAESQKAMNVATSVIRAMAYKMAHTIEQIEEKARPDEVEIEFSLKLDLETGTGQVLPFVAKTTAGGQFNIHFKWNVEKPKKSDGLTRQAK
jgi:hypothetical protein